MHKFLVRAASGIVYAAVIIIAILCGQWTIYALAIAFASIGVCELLNMSVGYSRQTLPLYAIQVCQVILLITILGFCLVYPRILTLTAIFLLLYIPYFWATRRLTNISIQEFASSGFHQPPVYGVGYLGLPLSFMVLSPLPRLALLVFVLLWINDSGAYIVGSLTGRHKLCPSISPNKTWEGFIGGCLLTIIAALLLDLYCDSFFGMSYLPMWIWIAIGVLTCIFGTIGDLIESKIKRYYGAKDSGHWIPGHGGILDRIDSFLLAYPIVFLVLFFLQAF